jgi:hypothetical protein
MTNKSKGLFDHVDAIYTNQKIDYFDTLTEADKKTYSNYMVNRFLSMNSHQIPFVNEIQKYNIDSKTHYLFFSQILPKGKQFNKYIKKTKEVKYEEWLVDIVTNHFSVSKLEAEEYLEIYYKQNKSSLRMLCEAYGIDSKKIKKAKL